MIAYALRRRRSSPSGDSGAMLGGARSVTSAVGGGAKSLSDAATHSALPIAMRGGRDGRMPRSGNGGARRRRGAASRGAELGEAAVSGDGEEPPAEAPRGEDRALVFEHGEEDLLQDVLRQGAVVDHAQHVREEPRAVAAVQLVERPHVARSDRCDQCFVGVCHRRPRNAAGHRIVHRVPTFFKARRSKLTPEGTSRPGGAVDGVRSSASRRFVAALRLLRCSLPKLEEGWLCGARNPTVFVRFSSAAAERRRSPELGAVQRR